MGTESIFQRLTRLIGSCEIEGLLDQLLFESIKHPNCLRDNYSFARTGLLIANHKPQGLQRLLGYWDCGTSAVNGRLESMPATQQGV
jgi:hypothetical protein